MDELISIIIPVYNVEEYLGKCLDSIINQTYSNLEIILIDDGSTDDSGNICDAYANADNRICVIHKNNTGAADSRNVGLDLAHGEYIGFVDSDDWICEKMYETLHKLIKKYNVKISSCERENTNRIYPSSYGIYDELINKKDAIKATLYPKKIYNAVWDKLYVKDVFQNIRFPKGSYAEDTPVVYKIIDQFGDIAYTNERLYFYNIRENSVSTSYFNKNKMWHIPMLKERIEFIDKNYPEYTRLAYKSLIEKLNSYYYMTSPDSVYIKFKNEHSQIYSEIKGIDSRNGIKNHEIPIKTRIRHQIIKSAPKFTRVIFDIVSKYRN